MWQASVYEHLQYVWEDSVSQWHGDAAIVFTVEVDAEKKQIKMISGYFSANNIAQFMVWRWRWLPSACFIEYRKIKPFRLCYVNTPNLHQTNLSDFYNHIIFGQKHVV